MRHLVGLRLLHWLFCFLMIFGFSHIQQEVSCNCLQLFVLGLIAPWDSPPFCAFFSCDRSISSWYLAGLSVVVGHNYAEHLFTLLEQWASIVSSVKDIN